MKIVPGLMMLAFVGACATDGATTAGDGAGGKADDPSGASSALVGAWLLGTTTAADHPSFDAIVLSDRPAPGGGWMFWGTDHVYKNVKWTGTWTTLPGAFTTDPSAPKPGLQIVASAPGYTAKTYTAIWTVDNHELTYMPTPWNDPQATTTPFTQLDWIPYEYQPSYCTAASDCGAYMDAQSGPGEWECRQSACVFTQDPTWSEELAGSKDSYAGVPATFDVQIPGQADSTVNAAIDITFGANGAVFAGLTTDFMPAPSQNSAIPIAADGTFTAGGFASTSGSSQVWSFSVTGKILAGPHGTAPTVELDTGSFTMDDTTGPPLPTLTYALAAPVSAALTIDR